MKKQKIILQIIALILIFGGVVRLLANEATFEIFKMGNLWVDDKYFIYIYRVLGAFVILTGFLFFSISRNIEKNVNVLNTMKWGLILVGTTMAIAGYHIRLPFLYYSPDFIFCYAISFYLYINSVIIKRT